MREFTNRNGRLHVAALAIFIAFSLGLLGVRVHTRRNRPGASTLPTLGPSSSLYREDDLEGDGNLDYGSLSELLESDDHSLIDTVHGSGVG